MDILQITVWILGVSLKVRSVLIRLKRVFYRRERKTGYNRLKLIL